MIQIALQHVFEAAIVDRRGKFGVETECLGKVGDGAVVIALLVAIDAAALEERIGIIRIKPDRCFKVGDGVVGIPLAGMEEPALEKCPGEARVQDDGLIEVGKGALDVVPVVRPDHGAPENRLGKIRIKADRFVEVRDGAVDIALAPQRKAAMVQHDRQLVRLDLSGLDPAGAGGDRVLAGLLGAIGRIIGRGEPGNHHEDCKGQRGDGEPTKPRRIHPSTPSRQQYRQKPSIAINRTTPGARATIPKVAIFRKPALRRDLRPLRRLSPPAPAGWDRQHPCGQRGQLHRDDAALDRGASMKVRSRERLSRCTGPVPARPGGRAADVTS